MHSKLFAALALSVATTAVSAQEIRIHETGPYEYLYEVPGMLMKIDNSATFPKITKQVQDDDGRESIALIEGALGAACPSVYIVIHVVDEDVSVYQPYFGCAEGAKAQVRNGKFVVTANGETIAYPLSYIK